MNPSSNPSSSVGNITPSKQARPAEGNITTPSKQARPAEGSNEAVSKELRQIDSLFRVYKDDSSDMIDPEGIMSFCFNLEVCHTDVRILMLAWKMEAKRQGYFTLEEWRRGLKALHADTINKIKKALSELEKEVARPSNFENFYLFVFRYCLTEDMKKFIDIATACELLDLVLGLQYRPQATKLVEYLKINFPSLDNYDFTLAWPTILDSFVEWMHKK